MNRFAIIILAVVLFFAFAARGQDWTGCGETHGSGGATTTRVSPQDAACYDYSDTTDSLTLETRLCDNIDIFFDGDLDGTNTDSTANIMCAVVRESSANTAFIIENTTLDGDASTNTEAIYGASCIWLWVDPQVNDPNSPRNSRVAVKCNR